MTSDIELYKKKNIFLSERFDEVSYRDFYRDIFPEGSFERKGVYEDSKGNGIALEIAKDEYFRYTVTDDLECLDDLIDKDFVLMNGLSYFGKERTMRNATLLYAMVFDIDGISDLDKLNNLINHTTGKTGISPKPTYLVNSGHGVHLYYVFEEPIPMYNHLKEPLKELKYYLTRRLWNPYVSDIEEPQYQGLNQAFRMVGTATKFGKDYRLKAFKIGSKVGLEYLNSFVPTDLAELRVETLKYESNLSLEEAKNKYPDWYDRRIVKKQKRTSWTVSRNLYDWWLRQIKEHATYGHRYFCIMALAIYAAKCEIPYEELEKDAMDLISAFNELSDKEPFTQYDVLSALNSYSEEFKNFPRSDIEKITAIDIPKNKRNYRTQKQHIELMNRMKEFKRDMGELSEGRPKGSGTKENIIKEYILKNPDSTPTEIARDLKVSRTTVYKYLK